MSTGNTISVVLQTDAIKRSTTAYSSLSLPSFADFIFRFERELHKLDNNIEHITDVLAEKKTLIARILKYFNSDDFKDKVKKYPNYRMETVEQIIKMYGIRYVQKFVLSYILDAVPVDARLVKNTLQESLTKAQCCSEVSHFVTNVKRDAAYMYGLVKDYGHIALSYKYGKDYQTILETSKKDPFKAAELVNQQLEININFLHITIAACFGIGLKREDSNDWIDERNILLATQEQFNPNFLGIEQETVKKLIAIGYVGTVVNNHIHGYASSAALMSAFESSKAFLELSDNQVKEIEDKVHKYYLSDD
jgi:hypothetical protein